MTTPPQNTALIDLLTRYAEEGWACPSIPQLGRLTNLSKTTVSEYMRRLRRSGKITSRLVPLKPFSLSQARIVTIVATGKSTKSPKPTVRYNKPADPPFKLTETAITSPVRKLTGREFRRRAAELLRREAEADRKREMRT